jgi:hypothetical protein
MSHSPRQEKEILMKPVLLASLFAVAALPACGISQQPRTYDVRLHAGVAAQPGLLGVRSQVGATLAAEVMRRLPHHFSVGPSLSVAGFPKPEQFISPAGCFGAYPCIPPSPSVVRIATFGVVGDYTPPSPDVVAPFFLVGLGMRHLTESPERPDDNRPYAEVGLGATVVRRFVVRARYQATRPGSQLPKWALPVTFGLAF